MRGLTYSNHDYCGAAHAVLTNNTLIKSVASYGSYHPNNQIRVLNRARLTLVDGGEIRTPVTNAINGGTTSGGVILLPDEEGYTSLIIDEGGIASWWCCNGSNKAVVEVANGFVEYNRTSWWGWHNRERILWAIKSVNIPQGKQMICRGIPTKYSTNDDTLGTTNFNPPFSGDGDLLIANTRKGNTFEPTIYRGDNTCTGRVVVAPDDDTAVARLHFANGANWAGTVRSTGYMIITNVSSKVNTPASVTFNRLHLQEGLLVLHAFRDASTGVRTIDNVNITENIIHHATDSGYLALKGEPFKMNETAILGTAPAGAWRDVAVRDSANNRLKIKELAPNETSGLVTILVECTPSATLILIR